MKIKIKIEKIYVVVLIVVGVCIGIYSSWFDLGMGFLRGGLFGIGWMLLYNIKQKERNNEN